MSQKSDEQKIKIFSTYITHKQALTKAHRDIGNINESQVTLLLLITFYVL